MERRLPAGRGQSRLRSAFGRKRGFHPPAPCVAPSGLCHGYRGPPRPRGLRPGLALRRPRCGLWKQPSRRSRTPNAGIRRQTRKRPTTSARFLAAPLRFPATLLASVAAELAMVAASLTPVTARLISATPRFTSLTARPISWVVAVCSSTALATVVWTSAMWRTTLATSVMVLLALPARVWADRKSLVEG